MRLRLALNLILSITIILSVSACGSSEFKKDSQDIMTQWKDSMESSVFDEQDQGTLEMYNTKWGDTKKSDKMFHDVVEAGVIANMYSITEDESERSEYRKRFVEISDSVK